MTVDTKTLAKMTITQIGVNGTSAEIPYDDKAVSVVDYLNNALGSTALCDQKFTLEREGNVCMVTCSKPLDEKTLPQILYGIKDFNLPGVGDDSHTNTLEMLRDFKFSSKVEAEAKTKAEDKDKARAA